MKGDYSLGTVVLIRPKFTKTLQPNPPIGLGYLASFLEKYGHKVILIDCWIHHFSNEEIFRIIRHTKPDIVGLTALTAHYEEMRELCEFISNERLRDPNISQFLLMIGGIHVTALPEVSLLECKADLAVLGEGENTLLELIEAVVQSQDPYKIDGIAYIKNNTLKMNKPRDLIKNLDELPFPAWHLMPISHYPQDPHGHDYKRTPFAPILTTRGCPFSCTYCASTNFWRRTIRYRSPKNVVDEIEYLIQKFGVREIHVWDDNLTLSKQHILGICHEIIRRKLDVTIKCPNGIRIDSLDNEILMWMRQAGFYHMILAIESGSQHVLNQVQKKLDLDKVPRIARLAKKYGFIIKGFFILGLPGETISSAIETIKFSKKIGLNFAAFFIAQPLPGSQLFTEWVHKKKITQIKWDEIQFDTGVYSLDYLPIKVLITLRNRGYLTFFARPYFLYTLLKFPKVTIIWFKNALSQVIQRFFERLIKKFRKKA